MSMLAVAPQIWRPSIRYLVRDDRMACHLTVARQVVARVQQEFERHLEDILDLGLVQAQVETRAARNQPLESRGTRK